MKSKIKKVFKTIDWKWVRIFYGSMTVSLLLLGILSGEMRTCLIWLSVISLTGILMILSKFLK